MRGGGWVGGGGGWGGGGGKLESVLFTKQYNTFQKYQIIDPDDNFLFKRNLFSFLFNLYLFP